jgi:hypothetical protein
LRAADGAVPNGLAEGVIQRLTPEGSDRSLDVVYRIHEDGRAEWGGLALELDVPCLAGPLLEPGVHRLRFSAPGWRSLEQSFTIREGHVADVLLAIERE